MSTKIYTGFILAPGTDIFALTKKAREYFLPVLQKRLNAAFMEMTARQYDRAFFSETADAFRAENSIEDGGTITVRHILRAVRRELKEYIDGIDNFQVKIGFAPDPETGRMLGYFLGKDELFDEFLEFEEVSDYHYQNSSDGPDGVSKADWEERRKAWDRVLPVGTFNTEMLVATIANPWQIAPSSVSFAKAQELGVEFPSVEARAKEITWELVYMDAYKDHKGEISGMGALYRDTMNNKGLGKKWSKIVNERIDKDITYEFFYDFDRPIGETL